MTRGSQKTNPDSGQSGIWTRNIRMQIQHPDQWATLPPTMNDDGNEDGYGDGDDDDW